MINIVFEFLQAYVGEMIIGGTFLGVTWIFKGMMRESLIEFAKLVWDKERMKDEAINRVLTLEANKHHGVEVDPKNLPKAEGELTRKYSDISNKYNEILEVTTASHQAIGTMMAELSEFKEYMKYRMSRLEYYNLTDKQKKEFSQLDFDDITGVSKNVDDPDSNSDDAKNIPKAPSKVSDILKNNKEN